MSKDNFIREYNTDLTNDEVNNLKNQLTIDYTEIKATVNSAVMGKTLLINPSNPLDTRIHKLLSSSISTYMKELDLPYPSSQFIDEGYEIQSWFPHNKLWINNIDFDDKSIRVLQSIIVLSNSSKNKISFKYQGNTPLRYKHIYIFPTIHYPYKYMSNSDLTMISTFIRCYK